MHARHREVVGSNPGMTICRINRSSDLTKWTRDYADHAGARVWLERTRHLIRFYFNPIIVFLAYIPLIDFDFSRHYRYTRRRFPSF